MENSQVIEKNAVEEDDRCTDDDDDDDGRHGEFREILMNAFNRNEKPKNFVTQFQTNLPDVNILGKGTKQILGRNPPVIVGDFPKESVRIKFPPKPERPFEPERKLDHRILNFFDEPWNLYESSRQAVYSEVSPTTEYVASDDVSLEKVSPTRMVNIEGQNEREQGQKIRKKHLYDEATMRNDVIRTRKRTVTSRKISRSRRDATSVLLKTEEGDEINITVEEPQDPDDVLDAVSSLNFARGKSFNSVLPPMPPLSTIIRPPHQGHSDKKKKPKPAKPAKEEGKEGNSEEIDEEQSEESSSEVPQTQENSNESVGVSPPPDGASVAEAKPIGLAIAGPGGVAAAKPQGTAVVGPGGLAIARPVGTAIAGVEVEGSVPIGGQHKHKKKPKQDEEKPEGELHYVGGLTGPIGHPQPTRKQFENSANFRSIIGGKNDGSDMEERLFFQGRQNNHGFQLKLGQKDGKYGFVPMLSSSLVEEGREFGQRVEAPAYFHGPSGTGENVENVFGNHAFRRA